MARWLKAIDDVLKVKVHHLQTGRIKNSEFIDWVDKQPTVEPKQEWISVEDRLPPDGNKPYLTCRKTVKGRTVIESRYLHTSYESPCVAYWEGKKNGEVTHWMPLPEPPERDGE